MLSRVAVEQMQAGASWASSAQTLRVSGRGTIHQSWRAIQAFMLKIVICYPNVAPLAAGLLLLVLLSLLSLLLLLLN